MPLLAHVAVGEGLLRQGRYDPVGLTHAATAPLPKGPGAGGGDERSGTLAPGRAPVRGGTLDS